MGCQVSTSRANQIRPSAYTPAGDPFEDYLKKIGSNDTYESRDVSVNLYKSRRNSYDNKVRCSSQDTPVPLMRSESICIIPEALRESDEVLGDGSLKPSDKSFSPTEKQLMKQLSDDPLLDETPFTSCRIKPGDLSLSSSFRRTRSPTDFMLSRSFDETDENLISFYRRKPSTAALIPEVITECRAASAEPTFMLSRAFLPTPSQNTSDGHMTNSSESVRTSKIDVVLEDNLTSASPAPETVVNDDEAALSYVHVDKSVTISCFAVQPDSWYTAPRPYLRVKIIPFVWW